MTPILNSREPPMVGHKRGLAGLPAAGWLSLAASPTFALMAVLAGAPQHGSHQMSCSAAAHMSSLGGMVVMYALMSAFHSMPWLKLVSRWRSTAPAAPASDAPLSDTVHGVM